MTADLRLGRIPQLDPRNVNFPIRTLLADAGAAPPRSFTWRGGPVLDQGREGSCVGHAFAGDVSARPVPLPATHELALRLYHRARQLDDVPGEAYEGTSVLAGAKAAREAGYLDEYRWAFTLRDAVQAIAYHGPVILGIDWYESFFHPDSTGVIRLSGEIAGGHAILAHGVSLRFLTNLRPRTFSDVDQDRSYVLLRNSWGTDYGLEGDVRLPLTDLARLLTPEADVCVPVRRGHGHPLPPEA